MKKAIIVLLGLLIMPLASAYETGDTPLYLYINPCSVFATQTACTNAGCIWCNGACQFTDCETSQGTTPNDLLNMTITIYNPDDITTPGRLEYGIILKNNNSYLVKGILRTWISSPLTGREYSENNVSVFVEAESIKTVNMTDFLFMSTGNYRLICELTRDPSGMKDKKEMPIEVKSATGFIGPETNFSPTESTLIILFLVMIIIVVAAILLVVTDYYKYLFSEPMSHNVS